MSVPYKLFLEATHFCVPLLRCEGKSWALEAVVVFLILLIFLTSQQLDCSRVGFEI